MNAARGARAEYRRFVRWRDLSALVWFALGLGVVIFCRNGR
jgi:hypothetical protein